MYVVTCEQNVDKKSTQNYWCQKRAVHPHSKADQLTIPRQELTVAIIIAAQLLNTVRNALQIM